MHYLCLQSAIRFKHCSLFQSSQVSADLDSFLISISITDKATAQMDEQSVLSAVEQLLTLNGWVAALCPQLARPFGQADNAYDELVHAGHRYFIGMAIHSADHFLVDQLAVIVQLARRLGAPHIFVSMLDYDSSDSTETLLDLCEAVLTLLGVPFRIRRVPPMTVDPAAAYYPSEEAHTRNLVLEPLFELQEKRGVRFHRVLWLKGFTCPNDILETIAVSTANSAAMVCGMDWAQSAGFYIFSDRWRTRDIAGDQFRQARSTSAAAAGPPRDPAGAERYSQHLPFQVFCCESGTHVVDPQQSYYLGIKYRSGSDYTNLSTTDAVQRRPADAPCLDSAQAWFCRDLWVNAAEEGLRESERAEAAASEATKRSGFGLGWGAKPKAAEQAEQAKHRRSSKRAADPEPVAAEQIAKSEEEKEREKRQDDGGKHAQRQRVQVDADANVGSDFDAMPDSEGDEGEDPNVDGSSGSPASIPEEDELDDSDNSPFTIPNQLFRPARILVNPRCVTTYAGVSHTQLAIDLFGPDSDEENKRDESEKRAKYVLDDWEGAPESFVCQEQRYTGGRKAPKTQRRLSFSVQQELERLQH